MTSAPSRRGWWAGSAARRLGQVLSKVRQDGEPGIELLGMGVRRVAGQVQATDPAEPGAVRAAQGRDGLGQRDGVPDGRLEIELVMVGRGA